MDIKVKKRDGRVVNFDKQRIATAVQATKKATGEAEQVNTEEIANIVTEKVFEYVMSKATQETNTITDTIVSVEKIQDYVEIALMEKGFVVTAKAYILYRARRNEVREQNSAIMQMMDEITMQDASDSDMKRENANIDADSPMGTMLKYGSETSKYYLTHKDLPKEMAQAHLSGEYHIHDLDFYNLTETCCQIPVGKLLKSGFSTGHGFLRQPNTINAAAALTCILIQANQNDQHGGQAVYALDYDLAPYVGKTYIQNLLSIVEDSFELNINQLQVLRKQYNSLVYNESVMSVENTRKCYAELKARMPDDVKISKEQWNYIVKRATERTRIATNQAMEALVANLNTMHSRAGAQVPFSSVNLGTDTSIEGRCVTDSLLNALDAGLGMGETSIFPVVIFKVKDGVNYNKTDPNYDLFHKACAVSAKRLFPNFAFCDAPYNLQYYKEGHPETEIAYMGCVEKNEVITYKINGVLHVEGFERAFNRIASVYPVLNYGQSKYIDMTNADCSIYDTSKVAFVKVKKFIKNPNKNNWKEIRFTNGRSLLATEDHPLHVLGKGRTFVKDMQVGDKINKAQVIMPTEDQVLTTDDAWLLGVLLSNSQYTHELVIRLAADAKAVVERISTLAKKYGYAISVKLEESKKHVQYYVLTLNTGVANKNIRTGLTKVFEGVLKADRKVPDIIFGATTNVKNAFVCGMLDANGFVYNATDTQRQSKVSVNLGRVSKELALQQMLLVESLGYTARVVSKKYTSKMKYGYKVVFNGDSYLKYLVSDKYKVLSVINNDETDITGSNEITVKRITDSHYAGSSYDVETESDMFDVSGIMSHNCRTRVIGNVYDKSRQIVAGRGNLSFTSINLPRLGLKAMFYAKACACDEETKINYFFNLLTDMVQAVIKQLNHRFEVQARRKVRNYPVLMQQGVWIDSEKLCMDDEIREVLKHGTLSVGFIGLAECLTALIGEHHGQSEKAQQLGLKIVGYMRELLDKESERTQMNYTLLATPAEGLSGTFVRKDQKVFGVIPGVTDKPFYTNSNHIPVNFPISAAKKIALEAPYHAMTNAGHICYVELDGDLTKNVEAFEQVVRYMKEQGIGYGSINHPVDRDPCCGYVGVINDVCPRCGRREGEKMSDEQWEKLQQGKVLNSLYTDSMFVEHVGSDS